MARTKVGTGSFSVDFTLEKEQNGALVLLTNGKVKGSNGLDQTFSHILSERDEITIGPKGEKKTYRRVGADGIELTYVGKNGKVDHKKSGGQKPGKVDFMQNMPFWARTATDYKDDNGGTITSGVLSVSRSIGNRLFDMVVFNLTQDGLDAPESVSADRGPKWINDRLDTIGAELNRIGTNLAPLGDSAFSTFAMVQSYTGTATTIETAIADILTGRKAELESEWAAKVAASNAEKAKKEKEAEATRIANGTAAGRDAAADAAKVPTS